MQVNIEPRKSWYSILRSKFTHIGLRKHLTTKYIIIISPFIGVNMSKSRVDKLNVHNLYSIIIINTWRKAGGITYSSLFVCLSVTCLYNKMNIADDFTLISKGFQLRHFSKMLSFKSYSFRRSF